MTRCAAVLVVATVCVSACSPASTPDSTGAAAPPANAATATAPAATPASTAAPGSAPAPPSASAPGADAAKPAAAPADSKPQFREVTIPAGTSVHVKLSNAVASNTSRVEDAVLGELAQPIVIDDQTVVPAGAGVRGSVLQAAQSGRVKGRASLTIGFDRLSVGDETHTIRTSRIVERAKATKREDAKKVGIGAGAGAVIGAIAGGKKGAAVGSAVGAGGGAGVVAATRGDEVQLAAGTTVIAKLREPLTIHVPVR